MDDLNIGSLAGVDDSLETGERVIKVEVKDEFMPCEMVNDCENPSDQHSEVEDELSLLLKSWDKLELLQHFKNEGVDINLLKQIECHHLERILRPFKYTTLISFEHNLKKWRESIGQPLFFYSPSHFGYDRPSTSVRSPPYSVAVSRPQSPTMPKSPTPPASAIALSTILNNNANGRALAESYDENLRFSDKQRVQLVNVIARYFDMHRIHLDLGTTYKLEKEIVERFPTEKLEYYRTSKRGKIYNKYCNLKFTFKNINSSTSTTNHE